MPVLVSVKAKKVHNLTRFFLFHEGGFHKGGYVQHTAFSSPEKAKEWAEDVGFTVVSNEPLLRSIE